MCFRVKQKTETWLDSDILYMLHLLVVIFLWELLPQYYHRYYYGYYCQPVDVFNINPHHWLHHGTNFRILNKYSTPRWKHSSIAPAPDGRYYKTLETWSQISTQICFDLDICQGHSSEHVVPNECNLARTHRSNMHNVVLWGIFFALSLIFWPWKVLIKYKYLHNTFPNFATISPTFFTWERNRYLASQF